MSKLKSASKVIPFIKPYWGKLVLSISATTLGTLFSLFSFTMAIPFLGILFDTQPQVTEPVAFAFSREALFHNFNYFLTTIILDYGKETALGMVSLLVIVLVFFKASFTYLGNYALAPIRTGIICDIRNMMYEKILALQLSYFSEERKGDLMSRMTGDVQEIERSIMQAIKNLLKAPIAILIYFISLLMMNFHLTLFVLVLLPLSGFVIGRIGKSLRRNSLKGQRMLGVLLSYIEETLFGLMIIKAFNSENRFTRLFKNENNAYSRVMKKIWRRKDMAGPLSEFLSTIVIVIIMFYGGSRVLTETINLSPQAFITYLIIFSQIITPAKQFSNAFYSMQRGLASIDRIKDIFNARVNITQKADAKKIAGLSREITYHDVSFKYSDKYVLSDIRLTIPKGATVALVGQSGAGKTTLANLLPRFYDVSKGAITIDGVDIRDAKIKDLRNLMGIVSQESILFNDTIYNNIAFGMDAVSPEAVVNAAKIANAHVFIEETEKKYQTNIGDRGSKLSGGQRQRISIARAILKNPPVLILDEATSSLDTESEYLVQDAIEKLMNNRTSIVIAHRLSTIKRADQIVVMDEGKIVEQWKSRNVSKGQWSLLPPL
ncbi:MAG: ABC transporter ATP-binding protein [Bacteroidales bacterium]|nr:ABC transporter ATP-binding protein [Bacteroidales bacterium]